MSPRRTVSVIVHLDGTSQSRNYRIPLWLIRLALVGAVGLTLLLVVATAFYAPLARQAARVPGLSQDVGRLQTENAKIRDLASALDSMEARYARLRDLIGADITPDPLTLGSPLAVAPGILARAPGASPRYEIGPSVPNHWPLEDPGYITRGVVPPGGTDESHPGLDIAVPVGTLVRAVGGGRVLQTGQDAEYGLFVLVEHPGGYSSRYGHLSAITTLEGRTISAGEVLGLSGNTGRSSAPHLHLEIRKDGAVVDPTSLITEGH